MTLFIGQVFEEGLSIDIRSSGNGGAQGNEMAERVIDGITPGPIQDLVRFLWDYVTEESHIVERVFMECVEVTHDRGYTILTLTLADSGGWDDLLSAMLEPLFNITESWINLNNVREGSPITATVTGERNQEFEDVISALHLGWLIGLSSLEALATAI